jgi:hypothetical protein
MSTPTLTNGAGASTQIPSGRHERPDLSDGYRALWAMTRDERIAAMWRGELTTRQLCQWSSRAQHEIPLPGGEFAWIAMRTPDWAEGFDRRWTPSGIGGHREDTSRDSWTIRQERKRPVSAARWSRCRRSRARAYGSWRSAAQHRVAGASRWVVVFAVSRGGVVVAGVLPFVVSGGGLTVRGVPARGSVRLVDGSTREMPLAELTAAAVLSAVPWRSIRSHRGQRHLPGWYWSATTGGHLVYESRLELARLLLADFDPDVVGIAAQPFLVQDADRRHVPDFLLRRVDGSVVIVNVKPAEQLDVVEVAEALAWAGRVFCERGWEHEVWSGADAQLLANVRFLAGYRRSALIAPAVETAAIWLAGTALTIAAAEAALGDVGVVDPRPVVLGLLWSGRLRTDLQRPLTSDSDLEVLW